MAASVGHLFLAVQALQILFPGMFNEREFIRGTLFPDIRYMSLVERASTHVASVSLDEIRKEKSSFRAGLLFHSWVDIEREKFVKKHGMYSYLPEFIFISQSLKIAEDHILREKFDVLPYCVHLQGNLLPEELAFGIKSEKIKEWYLFLQRAFVQKTSYKELATLCVDAYMPNSGGIVRWLYIQWYAKKMKNVIESIPLHAVLAKRIEQYYYEEALLPGN